MNSNMSGINRMNKRKRCRNKNTDRIGRKNHGIITVFVTLMMVPVVAITGIMVDVTRLKMYSSQAVMVADSYGEAVLSEYDNILKELYGLFSVTQNEEGLAAIEELNKYMQYSFNPDGDSKGLTGFMPYGRADVQLSYEKVEGASLNNNNVLATQIADFMKFRVVQELGEEFGLLSALEEVESCEKDMAAVEARNNLTNDGLEALTKINEYYEQLKNLDAYVSFIDGRKSAFDSYSKELNDIAKSSEYDDYCYYLEHKDEINAAFGHADAIEAAKAAAEPSTPVTDELSSQEEELIERFEDFDVDEYKSEITTRIEEKEEKAKDHESEPIDFDNTGETIDEIGTKADELEEVLNTLLEKLDVLKQKLTECSDDIRANIEAEIEDLEGLTEKAPRFKETYQYIEEVNQDKEKNDENKEKLGEELEKLDAVKEDILSGSYTPNEKVEPDKIEFEWYDFREDDYDGFLEFLEDLCESGAEGGTDANSEIERANGARDSAVNELNEMEEDEEDTNPRDISDALAAELRIGETSGYPVPGLLSFFSNGMSFEALGETGTLILDKFLLSVYDFGMFSCRVTGVRPPDDFGDGAPGDSSGEYADYSLTKIKMSGDVNYLYGAELEYLFGGHKESKTNLNEVRNIICGVRMSMNYISTYRIAEVNNIINTIADAAMEATAATGVGAPFAPLVRVAVSGALRLAVATIETVMDWKMLMERESVIFMKSKIGDLSSKEKIEDLLGISIGGSKSDSLELSYENYLYIMLSLLVPNDTLLKRTSELITLNVNQAARQDKDSELPVPLGFKMENTVTAVESTCKVKMDFVVVPDNIMKMYIEGTKTDSIIETLEDKYFGYTIIRGY